MRSDIVFLLCVCPVLDRKLVDGVKFGVVAIIVQGISSRCISLNTQKARTDIVFVDDNKMTKRTKTGTYN
jgi:hypothetical protein